MHITLRPGEKLYLNGAVLRTDRKVSVELLNDAIFLLEAHVMHVDKATTPVRQLYFIVQMMLMNPLDTQTARDLFDETVSRMLAAYEDHNVCRAIEQDESHGRGGAIFRGPERTESGLRARRYPDLRNTDRPRLVEKPPVQVASLAKG